MTFQPGTFDFPPDMVSSDTELNEAGTEAIARCSPSNPAANTLTFLGELVSEGIPHLIGSGLQNLRGLGASAVNEWLGHQYLNVEFGWKPFISDLRAIANAITRAHKIMNNFMQNSGKPVRRRYEFPVHRDSSVTRGVLTGRRPWTPINSSEMYTDGPGPGRVDRLREITQQRWFSGAFLYYVPKDESLKSTLDRYVIEARKLLGLSLTPDVIWSLAPWSWAVDWFSDTSDILKNWTNWAIDNEALMYGYMMEHTIVKDTYIFVADSTGFAGGGGWPSPITLVTETKLRKKATPYGFGLDWDGFSPTQLAITAALGLTKT